MKQVLALLLATGLLLCSFTPFAYADYATFDETYIKENPVYASREEAIASFMRTIGADSSSANSKSLMQFRDYGKISSSYTREIASAVDAGIISGYEDGTLRPQEAITRVEALVILNRILSERSLPDRVDLAFFDTPIWAEDEIARLTKAGIVKGYGDGYLGANDFLTREQTASLTERAQRLLGPAEDFYEYANEDWLSSAKIPEGYPAWSDSYRINQAIMKETGEIIYTINRKRNKDGIVFPAGSSEQKIADVFSAGGNTVFRDSLGLAPAQTYLNQIDTVKDMTSLLGVMADLEKNGFHGLLPLSVSVNAMNSSQYILTFSECYTGMNADLVHQDQKRAVSAYRTYLTELFTLFGYQDAENRGEQVTAFCLRLAEKALPLVEQHDFEKNYVILDEKSIKNTLSNLSFSSYTKELGFSNCSALAVYDLPLAKEINAVFQKENLELIKDYLRASVMDGSALFLNTSAFSVWEKYQNTLNGTQTQASPADYAVQFVEELLPWDLASLYVKNYASPSAKEKVEAMTKEILLAYQNRVRVNSWMSPKSKQTALKKLQNIQIRVGYPDEIASYPDSGYQIKSTMNGGNLLEYRTAYCRRHFEAGAKLLAKGTPDKTSWNMVPQTVNAMYDPSSNSITIPSGILRPPFYDPDASRERNLGGIGSVIAHEISHALDDMGSRFDENGNLNPWWQPEDELAFSQICKDVENAYSGIEVLPGHRINGKLTLNENIADLAGMSCLLDVVGSGNPRLEELFLGYASIWRTKATDSYTHLMLQTDTHAPDKIRVNRILSNFEVFQRFYGIQEGDGMYLPKEKQIQIWNR